MAVAKDFATKILKKIFGNNDFTVPGDWYLGLCANEPVNGVLSLGSEPQNGTGYQRYRIQNISSSFTPVEYVTDELGRQVARVTNANLIEMNEITGGGDNEPTVRYFFLSDSPTNSNVAYADKSVWIWGKFKSPRKLVISSNLIIEPGGAVFNIINESN